MKVYIQIVLLFFIGSVGLAQENDRIIDGVVAVIGDNMVLKSEIEEQFESFLTSGKPVNENTRCDLFEEMLFNKLLLNQAKEDSLFVGEDQINSEIDRRLRYFIQQFGSQEKLEEFYEKSIDEIKAEFHDPIEEQLMIQRMQGEVTGSVEVSPGEVKSYFNDIPKDSLPEINAMVEIAQIVKKPPIDESEKSKIREKILSIRDRVIAGEDFGTLAYLYSEDPGSSRENGELGFMSRGELVPEFSAVAFTLEPQEVSGIVETEFGYHIIQLIERRGQQVNVRHILMSPKVQAKDLIKAKMFLDTLKNNISQFDTLSFENAATLYSEDKDSRNNGGIIVNPMTGAGEFEMDQISQVDPSLYLMLDRLKVGEVAGPEVTQLRDGSRAYRLIKLLTVTEAHKANLKQDYQRIQAMALADKQTEVVNDWIRNRVDSFYIKVDESFSTCKFKYKWLPVGNEN